MHMHAWITKRLECHSALLEKKVQLGTLFVPYLEPSGKRVPKRVLYMFKNLKRFRIEPKMVLKNLKRF